MKHFQRTTAGQCTASLHYTEIEPVIFSKAFIFQVFQAHAVTKQSTGTPFTFKLPF
jgi:hypothetical protein